jgi:antirestriction protein ArdC
MSQTTKVTVADVIADRFIQSLKNGIAPWQKPWVAVNPQNGVSRKPYSGVNAFTLAFFGSDDYYLTFNQIKALGGQLEAGTKGLPVTYFAQVEDKKKPKVAGAKADTFLLARYYTVFPVNKCNLPDFKRANKVINFTPVESAEKLASLNTCPVTHGGNSAHYSPSAHSIGMPKQESFKSVEQYYATLFHEIGHSLKERGTHSKDGFGSKEYAKEELVAELFASICLNETGLLATTVFENSTAYLDNWLAVLTNDKTLIQKCASEAFKRFKKLKGEVEAEQEVTA